MEGIGGRNETVQDNIPNNNYPDTGLKDLSHFTYLASLIFYCLWPPNRHNSPKDSPFLASLSMLAHTLSFVDFFDCVCVSMKGWFWIQVKVSAAGLATAASKDNKYKRKAGMSASAGVTSARGTNNHRKQDSIASTASTCSSSHIYNNARYWADRAIPYFWLLFYFPPQMVSPELNLRKLPGN